MGECNHDFQELIYFYDDDWGYKGSLVWDRKTKQPFNLHYCRLCGIVKVFENEEQSNEQNILS